MSPATPPKRIALIATVFHLLGYAPHTEIYDPFNRPLPISRGRVLHEIL